MITILQVCSCRLTFTAERNGCAVNSSGVMNLKPIDQKILMVKCWSSLDIQPCVFIPQSHLALCRSFRETCKNVSPVLQLTINYWIYSQTCLRRPLLGPFESDPFEQLVVLYNTSIKRPLTKCGVLGKLLVFSHGNNCLNKDLRLRMFWCYYWRLKMF